MDLFKRLGDLGKELSPKVKSIENEEETKLQLVIPFFRELGYEPSDVKLEYKVNIEGQTKKVDCAILHNRKPVIFIETKIVHKPLTQTDVNQIRRYCKHNQDVQIGILTDGLKYRFFAKLDSNDAIDEKPYMDFDLLLIKDDDKAKIHALCALSKSKFDLEEALQRARRLKSGSQIEPNPEAERFGANDVSAKGSNSVDLPIHASFQERRIEAELRFRNKFWDNEKRVFLNGEWLTPKESEAKARKLIKDNRQNLDFWLFDDPDSGIPRPIKDLRDDELLKSVRKKLSND